MNQVEIIGDIRVHERGYSAVKSYEDEDGYISMGSTNEGWQEKQYKVLLVTFHILPCTSIKAGDEAYAEWLAIANRKDHSVYPTPNDFMWKLFSQHVKPRQMKQIMQNIAEINFSKGRNSIRKEFNELLATEDREW